MGTVPTLYFDLGSSYANLAAERAAAVLGSEPELEPVLPAAMLRWRGSGSWALTPAREPRTAELEERAGCAHEAGLEHAAAAVARCRR